MSTWFKKILWYLVLLVVSLFVMFFVWTRQNDDWGTNFFITSNWINHFRKWLDIAWWVWLTYKIDMSKYKEIYWEWVEYASIKANTQDIILSNVSNRISKLWVSDFEAKIETMNWEDYVVVEIWWLEDTEEAKQIIWKTVELEFKVKNAIESEIKQLEERKLYSEDILKKLVENPYLMEELWTGNQSNSVYYSNYNRKMIDELPFIYQDNLSSLTSLTTWSVYPKLLEGTHSDVYTYDENWEIVQLQNTWFTIVKYNWFVKEKTDFISKTRLSELLNSNNLEWIEYLEKWELDFAEKDIKYDTENKVLFYNIWEEFKWQDAYDIQLIKVNLSWEEEISKIKSEFEIWDFSDNDNIEIILEWRNSIRALQSIIPEFIYTNWKTIYEFNKWDVNYLLKVSNSKFSTEKLNKLMKIENFDNQSIIDDLKYEVYYNFEDIFIKNKADWITAVDPKTGDILNWAFFKYANYGAWQMWEPVVNINFDDKWKEIFCNITADYIGEQMAIFVGGELKTAPVIRAKICWWTAVIEWNFSQTEANKLVKDLNEWALPAPLILSNEEKISPTLWETAFKWAITAAVIWFILIFVLMTVIYNFKKWIISILGLVMFISVLMAFVKMIWYALSLSGISAIILSIWMAVDACVLIFEKVIEERKTWRSYANSIVDWHKRSISAIRDWNLTTWIIALLLFIIWTHFFRGFGFMMMVNIAITLLIIVPLTRDLLLFFYEWE